MNTLRKSAVTIDDRECELSSLFASLKTLDLSTTPAEVREVVGSIQQLLAPVGFKAFFQLEEERRKKRNSADISNWSYATGEIVLYYEPEANAPSPGWRISPVQPPVLVPQPLLSGPTANVSPLEAEPTTAPSDEIRQCIGALEDVEKQGRQFIAFKWFRDLVLGAMPYAWAKDTERRQAVLNAAIATGAIVLKKIPNPKSPAFPTTTVSLSRGENGFAVKSRFRPITVAGEPVSATLLRERGE
jgi:hypothetical protein